MPTAPPTPRSEVRDAVRNLLTRSEAFAALPPERQKQVARDTALIANYLAQPEGIEGQRLAGGLGVPSARAMDAPPVREGSYAEDSAKIDQIGQGGFRAGAAREGVTQAVAYIQGVNFPAFVGGL